MKKILFFSIVVIAFAAALTFISPKENSTTNTPPNRRIANPQAVEVLAQNLEIPWALDFLPDDRIIFTQRPGSLKVLSNGQVSEISTIDDVLVTGEGGLLGIAVDPDYESNDFIYLYYTYGTSGNNTSNKIVRYKLQGNNLQEDKVLIENIPGAIFHNGGRMRFGPDGFLYITTGDSLNPSLSQNTTSLAGKILRITRDGARAPGNPFNTLIYSYGHRNPQGLGWKNDRLYVTEHGSSAHDEVNVIARGGNFGWPQIQGDEKQEGMISPLAHSGEETWAPGGIAFTNDSLFFGGLRGQALLELKLDGCGIL